MKPLSWIRWKYALPLAIIVAAIVLFFVFFLDPLLASAIERIGGKVNGAKVDVAGLKTKIFQGRISIGKLQVANAEAPMENIFEAGPMAFQMDFGQLIKKRVIINEATMNGMGFSTPRKTSGALPKVAKEEKKDGPPSAAERLMAKYQDRIKLNIDGIKGDAKSRIEFDVKDLEMTRAAESIKEKAKSLPDSWERRVDGLQVQERLKKAEDDLKSIKQTPTKGAEAITAIPNALKKLGVVKNDLDQLKKDVQQVKSDIQDESKQLKKDVTDLPQAKQKDLNDLLARLNLDFASPDRLVEGILGPLVIKRFQTVFHYVEMARRHMPSKKEKESLPPKPRAKGMDIEFPTLAAPPRFWLMKAGLNGAYSGVQASGAMSDLTSDPSRVGKPFKLNLSGQRAAQRFTANATLDHTQDINRDSLVMQATGLDVTSLAPQPGDAQVKFTQGTASMNLALNLVGTSNIGGQIRMGLTGLKVDFAALAGGDKIKEMFLGQVKRAIETMEEVTVEANVTGTWGDPNLKFSSNLGARLAGVIKDSVGNFIKDQRKELESRLSAVLADKQKDVNDKLSGLESKANQRLAEFEAEIQRKISDASGINLSSGGDSPIPGVKLPSLKKLPW